ncbi:D-alanine--D-alanine ligase [Mucilaginibacter arboris]|uniref:D-alanine--D-alanine ligase n=1 Tax=Mucilaginibacter arboris TaxID=2682090 RepID=A0A7K1T0K6_9SPHI|nr:D-alanine--D-alanine ligase [Mucilaginibacter arboris]MVN23093.1 D-alanine--D-alanine ligase [Mucilaginibacter arboris]
MTARNIALMAGGYTGEYEVSINSARNIAANLDKEKYQVYTILVNRNNWFYTSPEGENIEVDKNDFSLTLNGEKIKFDAAFITIHGTPGEDGKLQGYFDMIGIPYNNCDAATSALTMNKAYTKAIVKDILGLHVAGSVQVFRGQKEAVPERIQQLKFPLFTKPNNGGSSVGMSKVSVKEALPEALEKAFAEDEQVLVEEFIKGREFSIGIVKFDEEIMVLPATEIISSKEFFDYEAKYTPGVSQEITPADLSEAQNTRIKSIVKEAYRVLNCKGMTRIDFILQEETDDFYFIEINTTPGQSANSLIPQQVRAAGMNLGEFYGRLIEEGLKERGAK